MKIYVGADHAGFKLKEKIKSYLKKLGYTIQDMGNLKFDPKDDYPDYGVKVAKRVAQTKSKGILFCGSSEGMGIVANKIRGIRAVPVWTVRDAKKSREHNDANVLCLSGWNIPVSKAQRIIKVWLGTPFSGAPRHVRRLKKIQKLEK